MKEGGEIGRERRDWEGEERLEGGERGRRDCKGGGEGGELYLVSSEFPHYSRRWLV